MRLTRLSYPDLGRSGLCNELFPLFRAIDAAESDDLTYLPPRWLRLRIGPLIRGELDSRQYWRIFKRAPIQLYAIRTLLIRLRIGDFPGMNRIVSIRRFAGMGNFFEELNHPGPKYRTQLLEMTHPRWHPADNDQDEYFAAHIRLGDFGANVDPSGETVSANNTRTPIEWFRAHITRTQSLHPEIPWIICSDGSDDEIASVLDIPNVRRSEENGAIGDLILLSRSVGMLGSRSTFTAWGAFLGEAPLLLPPGGNAYRPHAKVWESGMSHTPNDWLASTASRSRVR